MSDDYENSQKGKRNRSHTGVARTPEGRESQICAQAMDLAEKKIRDGTASSQLICHFLKRSDPAERVRLDILERQRDLIEAKTESIKAARRTEEAMQRAFDAMKRYRGIDVDMDDDDEFADV